MEKTKKTNHKGLKIFAIVVGAIILITTIFCLIFIDNKNINYEKLEINSGNVAAKIAHLSDLHFPKIEINIDGLVERLISEKPNIIAITGDLIDSSAEVGTCGVIAFIEKIKNIAPIYYVYGNHEVRNYENIEALSKVLKDRGVTVLNNESVNVQIGDSEITIIGLSDNGDYNKNILDKNPQSNTNYIILLAHRPEKWDNYSLQDKDIQPNLILTGHAHGGQIRFFGQGLVAPNQGLFPKYDSGIYTTADKNCSMIVSRGIGNSILPLRFNNKPHVPIITIKNLHQTIM